jgi:ubiquinone/menaquinone biosynthesis C-methylase UbiE
MSTTFHAATDSATETFFGGPVTWRAEAARALGLHDEDLAAAISPGAAFPAALRTMVKAMRSPLRTIVDIGSGVGGASEYLRRATGASVYAVEPSDLARETAQECFPELHQIEGNATETGLPGGCADAVVMCGLLSLIEEPDEVLNEARRLLTPKGHLAIADLYSAGDSDLSNAPNVFRTPETVIELCRSHGLELVEMGCGDPTPDPAWARIALRIDDWIERNRRDRDGYKAWEHDRRHLEDHISRGDVIGCCVVVAPPTAGVEEVR